jgi:hypothetical protein
MPGRSKKGDDDAKDRKASLAEIKERLQPLPPASFWQAQADCLGDDEDPYWFVWVTNNDLGLMIKHKVSEGKPSAEFLWEILFEAIEHPDAGEPERPDVVLAERGQGWEDLKQELREIGIRLQFRKHLTLEDGVPETMDAIWQARQKRREA